jgi:hypothetical protein
MGKKRSDEADENPTLTGEAYGSFELAPPPDVLEGSGEPTMPLSDAPPADARSNVSAEIFARVATRRPGQMAGFLSYARRLKLGPRPVEAWRELHKQYLNEPLCG